MKLLNKGGFIMDMGISENIGISYSTESPTVKKAVRENTDASAISAETKASDETAASSVAVSYEKSTETETDTTKQLYKPDNDLIQKLKTDAENRSAQLRTLVEQMLTKQGKAFTDSTNIWDMLRKGEVDVDPETAAQAKEDISEDGYWGVKQTSERLVSFAKALTGGDPSKADEMIEAFKKGYEQATKSWGGDLPSICKETYDSTIQQLNDWKNSLNTTTTDTAAAPAAVQ
jgi:hypothetical protein